MEIAESFVVNKSDRPGSDVFVREVEAALELDPRMEKPRPPRVFKISALSGDGVDGFLQAVEVRRLETEYWLGSRSSVSRVRAEARALLMVEAERGVMAKASQIHTLAELGILFRQFSKPQ